MNSEWRMLLICVNRIWDGEKRRRDFPFLSQTDDLKFCSPTPIKLTLGSVVLCTCITPRAVWFTSFSSSICMSACGCPWVCVCARCRCKCYSRCSCGPCALFTLSRQVRRVTPSLRTLNLLTPTAQHSWRHLNMVIKCSFFSFSRIHHLLSASMGKCCRTVHEN